VFEQYFIFGLGFFLVGHIFYILAFSLSQRLRGVLALPFIALSVVMFLVLRANIKPELVYPVLVRVQFQSFASLSLDIYQAYILVISTMGWRASARIGAPRSVSSSLSQHFAFAGALLFIVSDGLIAIDKFHTPIPRAKIYVMITCQYLHDKQLDLVIMIVGQTTERSC